MRKEKFRRGDMVHIAKDLGPFMRHFDADRDAIVMGSYKDQYGGDNTTDYTVMFCDTGDERSWYEEHQLTFLRYVGEFEIERIIDEKEKRHEKEGNLDWIIQNWKNIRENTPGRSMTTLMRLIGIDNPWPHGEGWELAMNQEVAFRALDEALCTGDRSKVEARANEVKEVIKSK